MLGLAAGTIRTKGTILPANCRYFFSVLPVSDVKLYGHWKHVLVLRRYWRPGLPLFGKRTARITDVSQNERIVSVEL